MRGRGPAFSQIFSFPRRRVEARVLAVMPGAMLPQHLGLAVCCARPGGLCAFPALVPGLVASRLQEGSGQSLAGQQHPLPQHQLLAGHIRWGELGDGSHVSTETGSAPAPAVPALGLRRPSLGFHLPRGQGWPGARLWGSTGSCLLLRCRQGESGGERDQGRAWGRALQGSTGPAVKVMLQPSCSLARGTSPWTRQTFPVGWV